MNVGTVYVEIRANTSQLRGDTNRARQQVVNNLRQGHSEMTSMLTNMRRALVAGLAFAAIRAVGGVSDKMAQLAISAQEYENLFTVTMGNMAEAGRAWTTRISKDLGVYRSELRRNVGAMNAFLRAMGVGEQQAYDMATSLVQLSLDAASLNEIPFQEAMQKLRSGMAGMARPLREWGVSLDVIDLQQLAFASGITKTVRELTQLEKVQVRYLQIMRQTSYMNKDLERTGGSLANQLRKLKEARKQAMEEQGAPAAAAQIEKERLLTNMTRQPVLTQTGAFLKASFFRGVDVAATVAQFPSYLLAAIYSQFTGDTQHAADLSQTYQDQLVDVLTNNRGFKVNWRGGPQTPAGPIASYPPLPPVPPTSKAIKGLSLAQAQRGVSFMDRGGLSGAEIQKELREIARTNRRTALNTRNSGGHLR